jgi:MerR family copper efflux transcriptional regulator
VWIGELARATGFTTQTLRYYGHLGLLEPERAANGYRQYTQAYAERLAGDAGFVLQP